MLNMPNMKMELISRYPEKENWTKNLSQIWMGNKLGEKLSHTSVTLFSS